MDELLEQFLIEGRELVEQTSSDLVALERDPSDPARLDTVFRAVHTLKGSVALFEFAPMGRALHAAEDLLGALRAKKAVVDRPMIDALLACVDASDRWIEEIARTEALPASAEQEARRITDALVAALNAKEGPRAATLSMTWLADLRRRTADILSSIPEGSGPITAVRYEPTEGSFLRGEDPVLIARDIPQLLDLHVSGRKPWGGESLDAYSCNLVIEALSDAPIEEIRRVLHAVTEQVVIVEDIASAVPDAPLTPTSEKGAENTARMVRVDAARIDSLVDLVGELIVAKNNLGHLAALAAESTLGHALAANLAGFERLTGDMHRTVMRMRVTPLTRTFGRFPRWIRETSAKLGKNVDLQINDNGVEADKTIVDGVFEPLLHVLRNALDHGIEDAAVRQAAGKPTTGRISVAAQQQGEQIEISVSDDGGGLDIAKIREIAKLKGVMSAEAIDALDDKSASDLIFMPGFSTTSTVTDISGRGVGMDSVRTAIVGLGGRVSMSSILGVGTTVRMTLPQAIVMSTVVTVEVGEERFGVPIDAVAETCRVPHDRIHTIRDGEAFVLRNRTLPLLRLSELLQLPAVERAGAAAKVLVVNSGSHRVGVEVDGVSERLDVLLRPMTGLLSGMQGVVGSALLGDGRVLLVLDLPELIG
jgi:two-component system, chemotaxis family, sensor kinase CheA